MESQSLLEDEQTIPTNVSEEGLPSYNLAMLYALFAIEAVSIVVSFVLFFALLIPLLLQLKHKTFHQGAGRRNSTRQSFQQPQNEQQPYSTYNLYLVYLALVDLSFFLPMFVAEMMAVNQQFHPQFYSSAAYLLLEELPETDGLPLPPPIEDILWYPYNTANLWINAVIAYEVLILLEATRRAQRINQPSLQRVHWQVGGVLLYSVVYGIFYYHWPGIMVFVAEANAIPVFSVLGISIHVKRTKLMPPLTGISSTPTKRAVRGLAFYFFRITMVFLVVWLPAMTFHKFKRYMNGWTYIGVDYSMWLLMYLQPIVTFGLVLGKDDVKQYVKDLVTLKYIFGDCTASSSNCCLKCSKEAQANESASNSSDTGLAQNRNEPNSPTTANRVTTILGYNFSNVDNDDENEIGDAQAAGGDTVISSGSSTNEEDTDPPSDGNNRTEENNVDAEV